MSYHACTPRVTRGITRLGYVCIAQSGPGSSSNDDPLDRGGPDPFTAVVRPGAVGSGIRARLRPTRYFSQREGRGRGSECCIKRMRGCAWSVGCTVPDTALAAFGWWNKVGMRSKDAAVCTSTLPVHSAAGAVSCRYVDCGNDFGATRTAERTSACSERRSLRASRERWVLLKLPRCDIDGVGEVK